MRTAKVISLSLSAEMQKEVQELVSCPGSIDTVGGVI
jgi:hypothetical protein